MDRYIQMSEAAREFQEREIILGDRVYLPYNLYEYKTSKGYTLSAVKNDTEPYYKKGFYCYNVLLQNIKKKLIYIPTQEVIQSKIDGPNKYILTSFVNFTIPSRFGSLIDRYTFDELWLMFYYFHVHGKMWNGEDWVKSKEGGFFT